MNGWPTVFHLYVLPGGGMLGAGSDNRIYIGQIVSSSELIANTHEGK